MLMSIPTILDYLLNIITTLIISFDKTKFKVTGKYSILLTTFYRPIGVVMFLIYLNNSEIENESTHNIASEKMRGYSFQS